MGVRTYVPEPRRVHHSVWTDKPDEYRQAVLANRRRTKRAKSKRLQRLRSERCERCSLSQNLGRQQAINQWSKGLLSSSGPAAGEVHDVIELGWTVGRTRGWRTG